MAVGIIDSVRSTCVLLSGFPCPHRVLENAATGKDIRTDQFRVKLIRETREMDPEHSAILFNNTSANDELPNPLSVMCPSTMFVYTVRTVGRNALRSS